MGIKYKTCKYVYLENERKQNVETFRRWTFEDRYIDIYIDSFDLNRIQMTENFKGKELRYYVSDNCFWGLRDPPDTTVITPYFFCNY